MRAIVVILDGVGVGALSDAAHYGAAQANTLSNVLGKKGLCGFDALREFGFSYFLNNKQEKGQKYEKDGLVVGKLKPITKDNDSGPIHWEMMGVVRKERLPLYPGGISKLVLKKLEKETGYKFIGNIMIERSCTLDELRKQHQDSALPVLYATSDSVVQVAAMEECVPLKDLYKICEKLRQFLPLAGRIVAKPFILNKNMAYERDNRNRKDYMLAPPRRNLLLLKLQERKIPTIGIGKISDFFQGVGISKEVKTGSNLEGIRETKKALSTLKKGFIFTNLVDFDICGHSNDTKGMLRLLKQFNDNLPSIVKKMKDGDLLILSSDHGCDPTQETKTHTRENGLLVCYQKNSKRQGVSVFNGGFIDIAATLADYFKINFKQGVSFVDFPKNKK